MSDQMLFQQVENIQNYRVHTSNPSGCIGVVAIPDELITGIVDEKFFQRFHNQHRQSIILDSVLHNMYYKSPSLNSQYYEVFDYIVNRRDIDTDSILEDIKRLGHESLGAIGALLVHSHLRDLLETDTKYIFVDSVSSAPTLMGKLISLELIRPSKSSRYNLSYRMRTDNLPRMAHVLTFRQFSPPNLFSK